MSAKTNHGNGKFSSQKLNEINPEVALTRQSRSAIDDKQNTEIRVSLSQEVPQLAESEPNIKQLPKSSESAAHHPNAEKPRFKEVKSKTAAIAACVVMLPILAVGSATYYFGSQTIDKQLVLTRRENNVAW